MRWFGLARLSIGALSVTAIAVGMWWLLRAPAVPVEQKLPFATGDVIAPTVTPIAGPVTSPSTAVDSEATGSSIQSPIVVVHVAGNVNRPGIYTLATGSRVADAVDAAGGVGDAGDLDSLNLAAPIVDGERIYVPAEGEVDPASVVGSPAGGAADARSSGGATPGAGQSGPVNINTADAAELESLPGVGPATAAAIVDDRERNGPYRSVDDLERVRGIGPAKLAGLIDLITT